MKEYEIFREPGEEDREEEQHKDPLEGLTRQERRWVALGALKSGLLIGLVYLAAGAGLIGLMLLIWNHM
jgi:hypothetical protein